MPAAAPPADRSAGAHRPTIGVLGGRWRATVTPWGGIEEWDGGAVLDWHVAADDRWHSPAGEPTVRQSSLDGTPVVETRLRIPQGDAVQRIYAVADHGGITLVEVHNDSPLPIAVAFTGAALLSVRPPAAVAIEGIDLPAGTSVFPVGHHATLVVGLDHRTHAAGALPTGLPSPDEVARGWLAASERASRLSLPEPAVVDAVVRARCQLLLDGPADPVADPVDFLFGVAELVRMGGPPDPWMPEVVDAVAALAGHLDDAFVPWALDAAARVCRAAGEHRAERDLAAIRTRLLGAATIRPASRPAGPRADDSSIRFVTVVERAIADGADLFAGGVPAAWMGQNFEVHAVPTGVASAVSFALRWHGARPAVLWECAGDPVTLTASAVAPGWSTDAPTGEALWPAPAPAPTDDVSFS